MAGRPTVNRPVRARPVALTALTILLLSGCQPPEGPEVGVESLPILSSTPSWTSSETDSNTGMSWGDWDGDGDLDLAVCSSSEPSRVYENTGSSNFTLAWTESLSEESYGCEWGDADGDGDLDFAVANKDDPNRVYAGDGAGGLTLDWSSSETDDSRDGAWADWDGDGDLDLAVAPSEGCGGLRSRTQLVVLILRSQLLTGWSSAAEA